MYIPIDKTVYDALSEPEKAAARARGTAPVEQTQMPSGTAPGGKKEGVKSVSPFILNLGLQGKQSAKLKELSNEWKEEEKYHIPLLGGFARRTASPTDVSELNNELGAFMEAKNVVNEISNLQRGTGESVLGTARKANYEGKAEILTRQMAIVLKMKQLTSEESASMSRLIGDPKSITGEWLKTNQDKIQSLQSYLDAAANRLRSKYGVYPGRMTQPMLIDGVRVSLPVYGNGSDTDALKNLGRKLGE
jgi:hypothetical protein